MKIPASAREDAPAADGGADEPTPEAEAASPSEPSRSEATSAAVAGIALLDVRRLLTDWLAHEPGARLGHDPEDLHQLRVTARRLDATLGLFKHELPASLTRARKTAKGLLRSLGQTRDLDVQLAGLAEYCDDLPAEERAALEPLREHLALERTRARARMVKALDAEPTRRWLEVLEQASAGASAESAAEGAADAALAMPERVRRRFRRLRKAVRRLRSHSSMDDYHKVRRRAKQLRYALDSGTALYGKPAEEMLKALRRLQNRLGVQQDAYMARKHLTALAADPRCGLPPATLFHMGRLAEHHLRITAEARGTVAKSWRKLRGRRWKALRARLGELAGPHPEEFRAGTGPEDSAPGVRGAPAAAPESRPTSH
jgi:CHAD domain-containing protein